MAFLTVKELYTHIYEENVEEISRGDNAIPEAAIDAAVMEAKGYLSRYDTDKVFKASGRDRNALLLTFVKDIAAWHFINLCNAGVELELREKRYDRAIDWLKSVQKGNTDTDLPEKSACPCHQPIGSIAFGSNKKRDNHF